jgi:hypothetical protein
VSEQSRTLVTVRESVRTLEHRMDARFDVVDRRIDTLDEKVSRQFVWLVGLQVTTLGALVGALLARP